MPSAVHRNKMHLKMKRIEALAGELLDTAPDAIVICDVAGTILYVNGHAQTLFGYRRSELLGSSVETLLPDRFRSSHPALRSAYARKPRLRSMGEHRELFARHRNGTEFGVHVRLNGLPTPEGLVISSTIREVTALQSGNVMAAAQDDRIEEYVEATARALLTLNSIDDAIISGNPAGEVTYLNPVAEAITGWSRAEAAGRPLQEVLQIVDGSSRKPVLLPTKQTSRRSMHLTSNNFLVRRDGTQIAVEGQQTPLFDGTRRVIGTVVVLRDASAERADALQLIHAAHHDALTGLPNRVLLRARVEQAIASARRRIGPLALLYIDLDNFKQVNDTQGHLAGDGLLQTVAQRLQNCVRSTDTVSRVGGDEFVVLLSEIAVPADAAMCAQKILSALNLAYVVDQAPFMLSASIGISVFPQDGTDVDTLLRKADNAMFNAKRHGGNAYRIAAVSEGLRS